MYAVVNDGLRLLYMQRIRYRALEHNTEDTILEVAYDIRDRPDLQATTAQTAGGPWRQDVFAVFHFHTYGLTPAPNNAGPEIPLITYFHAFHGQRVARDRAGNAQYVIENRETVSFMAEIDGSLPHG